MGVVVVTVVVLSYVDYGCGGGGGDDGNMDDDYGGGGDIDRDPDIINP